MSRSLNDVYKDIIDILYRDYKQIIKSIQKYKRGKRIIKLCVIFFDNSFLDILWSESGKYSLHWERRHIDDTLYWFDNAPHWENFSTYPNHFHNGSETNITPSRIPHDPVRAVREFMQFIKDKLTKVK